MNTLAKLEQIKNVPAIIEFDFETVKAQVMAHLEKYNNVVITSDAVKEGKDLIKEINVTRKAIHDARIAEVKKASEPIKFFEDQMKELVSLHDSLLDSLRVQIAKFDEEQKVIIRKDLEDALNAEWGAKAVRPEFRSSKIDSLVLLGSHTAKGKLTAKAIGEVKALASNDYALQIQTDLRISQLETACYQAGLAAPLTKEHVSSFIFAPEVEYQTRLNALLASEIEREKKAVEHRLMENKRAADKLAAEQAFNQPEPVAEPVAEPVQAQEEVKYEPMQEEVTASTPTPVQSPESSRVTITCTFELNIPAHIPDASISSQLKAKLETAGFTTLTSLNIARGQYEKISIF